MRLTSLRCAGSSSTTAGACTVRWSTLVLRAALLASVGVTLANSEDQSCLLDRFMGPISKQTAKRSTMIGNPVLSASSLSCGQKCLGLPTDCSAFTFSTSEYKCRLFSSSAHGTADLTDDPKQDFWYTSNECVTTTTTTTTSGSIATPVWTFPTTSPPTTPKEWCADRPGDVTKSLGYKNVATCTDVANHKNKRTLCAMIY
eukprot:gene25217-28693_t